MCVTSLSFFLTSRLFPSSLGTPSSLLNSFHLHSFVLLLDHLALSAVVDNSGFFIMWLFLKEVTSEKERREICLLKRISFGNTLI